MTRAPSHSTRASRHVRRGAHHTPIAILAAALCVACCVEPSAASDPVTDDRVPFAASGPRTEDGTPSSAPDTRTEGRAPSGCEFPQLTADAAWTWFGGPRAVSYEGSFRKTYTGWITSRGDVEVASIDRDDGSVVIQTLWTEQDPDDHSNPSILVLPDGRLMVFCSPHCWKRTTGKREGSDGGIFYRVSSNPEDVSEWEPSRMIEDNVSGGFGWTYPKPLQLSAEDGRIYLFWRGGNGDPVMALSDDGEEWTLGGVVVETGGRRPYLMVASNDVDEMHIAFTRGHPAEETENSIYYVKYRDGSFYRADGTRVCSVWELPLSHEECDVVYDGASSAKAWLWDIAFDEAGDPVIAYAVFPRMDDHRYRYVRWREGEWRTTELTEAGAAFPRRGLGVRREEFYSGGLTLDHDDPGIVYLSRPVDGVFELERWVTEDGGDTWSSEALTSGSTVDNVRPVVPLHRSSGDPALLWMAGIYYRYDLFGTGLRYIPGSDASSSAGRVPVRAWRTTSTPSRGHADRRQEDGAGASSPGGSASSSGGASPSSSGCSAPSTAVGGTSPTRVGNTLLSMESVAALAARVCDAELAAHAPRTRTQQQWCEAVMHMGVMAALELTGEGRFFAATREWCESRKWSLGPRRRHADDLSPAQVYLDVWELEGDPAALRSAVEAFNAMLADPRPGREEWSWCDALFMAPPAMAHLSEATGDSRYVDAMDEMWWDVVDHLYDSEQHLFYRDAKRKPDASSGVPPGSAVSFWGRGNGWVMAGTARVLAALPHDHPSRPRYEKLLLEMASAVAELQGDDGLWRPDLLRSRENPDPDTSCSALFTCAIAWGVAEGVLPEARFLPVVSSAWDGLAGAVDESGRLGWVQPIGAAPASVRASHRADYGAGAFLLAAREVARLSALPNGRSSR